MIFLTILFWIIYWVVFAIIGVGAVYTCIRSVKLTLSYRRKEVVLKTVLFEYANCLLYLFLLSGGVILRPW